MALPHHLRSAPRGSELTFTAEQAGWQYLHFAVHGLEAGKRLELLLHGREAALVPLSGRMGLDWENGSVEIRRASVFLDPPHVFYAPPNTPFVVTALTDSTFTVGSAAAEGKYPVRLFGPEEMRGELRGHGPAQRQVNHLLAAPLPAERLILYEIVAPRGGWCGWPPHCHDGFDGSPYLEETYYFRFDRPEGTALHRNYRTDEPFDETFAVKDGDVVLVTKGYHTTVVCPGANMYFLNYLAGELLDDERARPPCFQQVHTWINHDSGAGRLSLPTTSFGLVEGP